MPAAGASLQMFGSRPWRARMEAVRERIVTVTLIEKGTA